MKENYVSELIYLVNTNSCSCWFDRCSCESEDYCRREDYCDCDREWDCSCDSECSCDDCGDY